MGGWNSAPFAIDPWAELHNVGLNINHIERLLNYFVESGKIIRCVFKNFDGTTFSGQS